MTEERPMAAGKCCRCGCRIWLTPSHYYAAMEGRSKISFHCGYGHAQHFCDEDDEFTKVQRERDRLKQQLAQKDDEVRHWMDKADKANQNWGTLKAQQMRTSKRISHGTCPHCQRTFKQLAAHMKSKHAEIVGHA